MEITVTPGQGPDTSVVAISGAMTIYDAAAGKDTLLEALNGAAELEIDLSEVAEVDTAGLQLLVLLMREAASAGKRVALSRHSPAVLEVFHCYRISEGTR
jgi:anti-anti-sigma factor